MSTLQQHTSPDRRRIAARPGAVLALTALIAIGLALLILMPTGHGTTTPTTGSIARPPAQDNIRPIILAVAPFRKTGWIKGGTPNQGPSTHPKPRHRNARGVTTIALHPPDASRRASASRRRGLDPSSALNECRGCRGVRPRHRLRDCRIVPAAAGRR